MAILGGTDVVAAGSTSIPRPGWLARYDADGTEVWAFRVDHANAAVDINFSDEIIVCGSTGSDPGGLHVTTYWGDGTERWAQISGGSSDACLAVANDSDGNIGAVGHASQDAWIAKLDLDGTRLWTATPIFSATDYARAVAFTPAGRMIVGGESIVDEFTSTGWLAQYEP